ncbi:nuclease-related domain-containing protein [Indiicoccus explosivorum]|uniref:nuclease-related domain-containing protein n=1 Tax=Indiicoccus explosivorum TaxID=1917864 RepID=UPI0013905364|nr:nuclease-related domain-containing protein [Indiicoccus explosivorum]
MIMKQREEPRKIAGYEALLHRLPERHPKRERIQELLETSRAGYGGEANLDRIMFHFQPAFPAVQLRNLELGPPYAMQADTIVLTRSRLVLLEVKNLQGRLFFYSNPHVLVQQRLDGIQKTYTSPVVQVQEMMLKLDRFMRKADLMLPIEPAIVISYPSQIVEKPPDDMRLLAAREVNFFLSGINEEKPLLSGEELYSLGRKMAEAHSPYEPFPLLQRMEIGMEEIIQGVRCPGCGHLPMVFVRQRWRCPGCGAASRDAHRAAVRDLLMLSGPIINAGDAGRFLGIAGKDVPGRMLMREGLKATGNTRSRTYEWVR